MINNIEFIDLIFNNIVNKTQIKHLQQLCQMQDSNLYNALILSFRQTIAIDCSETLITEYNFLKEQGVLQGLNRKERMAKFEKIISNNNYVQSLFQKYPLLQNWLTIKINDLLNESLEILSNFNSDKEDIYNTFGNVGSIKNIKYSQGDLHNGKTVCIVEFSHEQIAYKPRNMLTDKLLERILNHVVTKIPKKNILFPKYLNYDTHSWQEFIEYSTCNSMEEIKQFYYNSGIYLAIFYLLGTTDMHYENLIANRYNPMFIDLETLVNGIFSNSSQLQNYKDFNSSVLRTSMLPLIDKTSSFDINLSALFTGENTSKTLYGTVLVEDEEKDWVFKKIPYQTKIDYNIPTLNGEKVSNDIVINDLIDGFRNSLNIIIQEKESIKNILIDTEYEKMKIRQLLRPSRVYSKFIDASHNPLCLSNKNKFNQIFEILINNL